MDISYKKPEYKFSDECFTDNEDTDAIPMLQLNPEAAATNAVVHIMEGYGIDISKHLLSELP